MDLRWLPLLAGLVTALGSTACYDANDDTDGGGRGGSAGSNGGAGDGGGGSSQAGSTGLQPSKVGLQLSLEAPDPALPNTECFPSGVSSIGTPAPSLDPLDPGEPVSDGDSDVSVVCSVKGPGTFSVSATIAQDNLRFKISDGTIDTATGTGTFELLIDTVEAGDIVTEADQLCTFSVSELPLEVSEGQLFATFECPVLWNHATATDTACGAHGAVVLEFCEH
jgi:hypothetical protein